VSGTGGVLSSQIIFNREDFVWCEFTLGVVTDGIRHNSFSGNARVVNVWWNGSKRDTNLNFRSNEWNDYNWFGFACASLAFSPGFGRGSFVSLLCDVIFWKSKFSDRLSLMHIVAKDDDKKVLNMLEKRTDSEAARIRRFMAMPDLSRTPGSPIAEIVKRVIAQPDFAGFDTIETSEIVPVDITFDLFDFAKDHPARSKSDTYYVDDTHILRTHTTIMWYYYLQDPDVKARMERGEAVGCFSFGKVYRKDEIDRHHMNVFHQIDGWYLIPKDKKIIGIEDLQNALLALAKAAFGEGKKYRFNPDTFPYTDPSLEMEIEKNGKWLEILGSGVVKGSVLEKFGIDSTKWNGWAFGPGIERLAIISIELPDIRLLWSEDERVKRQLKLGNKFKEVSKYPPITRDISFIVASNFIPNNYFDLIRDIGSDLVEEVKLLDKYENEEKFGKGKISYTYRITYRSIERTLTDEEVNTIQKKIYDETARQYNAGLR